MWQRRQLEQVGLYYHNVSGKTALYKEAKISKIHYNYTMIWQQILLSTTLTLGPHSLTLKTNIHFPTLFYLLHSHWQCAPVGRTNVFYTLLYLHVHMRTVFNEPSEINTTLSWRLFYDGFLSRRTWVGLPPTCRWQWRSAMAKLGFLPPQCWPQLYTWNILSTAW